MLLWGEFECFQYPFIAATLRNNKTASDLQSAAHSPQQQLARLSGTICLLQHVDSVNPQVKPDTVIYLLTSIQEMPSKQWFWWIEKLDLHKLLHSFSPPAWPPRCFASAVQTPWALLLSRRRWLSDWPVGSVRAGSASGRSTVPHALALQVVRSDRRPTRAWSWWRPGTAA